MLDTDNIEYADIPNIKVDPSDKIFNELGKNTYNYIDLISELIDNSIAARFQDEKIKLEIEIGISEEKGEKSYFIIRDNGEGMAREDIGKAISPGAKAGGDTLNEHGLGMKQAISALGDLEYIATKTKDDDEAIIIEELKFGDILPKTTEVEWNHGTEICLTNLNSIVKKTQQSYTKSISTYLGARYRRFLKSENPILKLKIKMYDLDDIDDEGNPQLMQQWRVTEVRPVYFHPNERCNKPVILKKKFNGDNWEAEFTFGYAPKEEEYEVMGLEPPKQYEPYKVSLTKQGFDIIRNDRVIIFHQLSELDIVPSQHNKYNLIRGEIDLLDGFTTAITKNNIIADKNFYELISEITEFLKDNDYLKKKTYPDELPEKLLRDRLADQLKTHSMPMLRKDEVQTEYSIGALNGYVDILADGEAWELKTKEATGLDIYQLFAYMDMGELEVGFLVAPSFSTGAEEAMNFINDKYNKEITLVTTDDFNIMYSPSNDEIKKYY